MIERDKETLEMLIGKDVLEKFKTTAIDVYDWVLSFLVGFSTEIKREVNADSIPASVILNEDTGEIELTEKAFESIGRREAGTTKMAEIIIKTLNDGFRDLLEMIVDNQLDQIKKELQEKETK